MRAVWQRCERFCRWIWPLSSHFHSTPVSQGNNWQLAQELLRAMAVRLHQGFVFISKHLRFSTLHLQSMTSIYMQNTWYQSIVQQFIRDGNCRRRFRKAFPIGLKATTTCRFCLQRATKKANRVNGLSSRFLLPAWAMGRIVCEIKRKCFKHILNSNK